MPRKLSPEHTLELESLYRVIATIAVWYDSLSDRADAPRMAATMRAAYEANDLRGLRMAYNDLVEMTRAADAAQRRELNRRLQAEGNTTLEALDRKTRERIERIRARGNITSEEQYHLVREHVEFIATTPGRAEEARELLALLEAFELRAASKRD
jgi:hypothetical protein